MTRFTPSRSYLLFGILAALAAVGSVWFALQWPPSWFAVALFTVTAAVLLALALRPPIRITDDFLKLGRESVAWAAIRRIEHRGWLTPLVVRLTLMDQTQVWVVYAGDTDSSQTLLQFLYRFADQAATGMMPASAAGLKSPNYPLLKPEDEEEIERLYHRLRSVGHLDPKSNDEN
jgi:hypothetical protein